MTQSASTILDLDIVPVVIIGKIVGETNMCELCASPVPENDIAFL